MKISLYTEMAVAVALAAVLGFIKIKLPYLIYGGSVSLNALPIFVVAFRHGGRCGITAGALYGVVDFIIEPYIVHPVQVFLDYPLAFGALGVAGFFWSTRIRAGHPLDRGTRWRLRLGILGGMGGRFMAHFASGIVFWGQNAPEGQPVWLYSLVYNGSYIGVELVMYILLTRLILRLITLRNRE